MAWMNDAGLLLLFLVMYFAGFLFGRFQALYDFSFKDLLRMPGSGGGFRLPRIRIRFDFSGEKKDSSNRIISDKPVPLPPRGRIELSADYETGELRVPLPPPPRQEEKKVFEYNFEQE